MSRIRAVLFAALILLAGCGGPTPGPTAPPADAGTALPSSTTALPPSNPVHLRIPSIGAASTLVPLGLNPDDTVEVPPVEAPMQAGWYRYGPTPGELGPAVVLGHVDGGGRDGIFARLREIAVGDQVFVTREDGGTATFTVTRVVQVPKARFPSEEVYGDTGAVELRLITCGGSFDRERGSYRDNVIAYATLSGAG
ncbi:class F sortase [Saccharopolyspora rhizosphaerae]|uniref:Class F sortase n=1 Tax=Saccharopolyspora rhizosphaerae TaxID=2492662 RepID=A0A3R8P727_9PSEU|nr:class F sortase [Saccharopolyspora rhizosphaerae]RRO17954.1 class F sortase [Saccharopolyspora rhizosphaerae]